jgi:hypothetical protein
MSSYSLPKGLSRQFIYFVAILGSILSFLPFFGFPAPYPVEDDEQGLRNSFFYRESSISTLFLIIPTTMDILLDLSLLIAKNLTVNKIGNIKKPHAPIIIVRLTVIERSLFVVGVAMQCLVNFAPVDANYLLLLYHCASNCSTVLTICPILMFLERCTTSWTSATTMTVAVFTVLGATLNSTSYCLQRDSVAEKKLYFASSIFFILASMVYVFVSCICASYYILQKSPMQSSIGVRAGLSLQGGLKKEIKVVDEMYENYIPAAHIFSGIMFVILNATWNRFTKDNGKTFGQINYVLIGIATWVLVVEFRIRKNEVERGLVSLITTPTNSLIQTLTV